ncbi:hypothetical protein [Mucilaginibacter lacusdianchii]|uniref:hypothetical protein n=1 Tax=Mucilaginibacter lacusdianchii TaxID=2684211 RepID=UPI00131CCC6B|nr:hypothetical protein [Mucilaginibacter sp. JXJ CY 39]
MGYTNWSDDAYSHLKGTRAGASVNDIFANNKAGMAPADMLPNGVHFRESRDSSVHPESLSIMVMLDVTGSMGRIPEVLVREKLGALMNTLIDHGVAHPQILFGGIGDHITDHYPLQVGQFESGTEELDKWLTGLYLEGGGGGQKRESYLLAWLFGARHTSCDCFEKRGQKGFLFTIGDEANWDQLDSARMKALMGYTEAQDVSDRQLLEEVQRSYHVFHIHINEASYKNDPEVIGYWKDMLGERLIILEDYNAIAETIATTVAVIHGVDMHDILKSFDNKTANTVGNALMKINTSVAKQPTKAGGWLSGIFKL